MRLARGPSGQRRASYRRPALLRIPGLYQPLIQHGLAYFAEAGGVGAIDVVDVAMLPAEAHALVVDGLHDFVQALVHLVIGPLEPHAILRHLQSADRHAAGVGRLAGAEENLLAEKDFHRLGRRGHIGAFAHADAAVADQGLRVAAADFILRRARQRNLARHAPGPFALEILALDLLGVFLDAPALNVLELLEERQPLGINALRVMNKTVGIGEGDDRPG